MHLRKQENGYRLSPSIFHAYSII